MNLLDARRYVAPFMKAERDFWNESIKPIIGDALGFSDGDIPADVKNAYGILRGDTKNAVAALAAIPDLFDVLESCFVNVSGKASFSQTQFNEMVKTMPVEDILTPRDNLADSVKEFIEALGFKISDRGTGLCEWDMGVVCTETDARRLCTEVHKKFEVAISQKLLLISKYPQDPPRVPGLINWGDLDEWLKENPL